jgi:hypothetical protein
MNWAGKQNPIETLVEWVAPALLAAAAGWAAWRLGLPPLMPAISAAVALGLGVFIMRRLGVAGSGLPLPGFVPAALGEADDVLLLDDRVADDELLLDDPLTDIAPDSRVVRLFERQDTTPGELVERISDFLGDGRRAAPEIQASTSPGVPADASIALHAALANIRASLR